MEVSPQIRSAPLQGWLAAGRPVDRRNLVKQQGEGFTLFVAVDPETRHLLHAAVAPWRNYLTTRRFLSGIPNCAGAIHRSW